MHFWTSMNFTWLLSEQLFPRNSFNEFGKKLNMMDNETVEVFFKWNNTKSIWEEKKCTSIVWTTKVILKCFKTMFILKLN